MIATVTVLRRVRERAASERLANDGLRRALMLAARRDLGVLRLLATDDRGRRRRQERHLIPALDVEHLPALFRAPIAPDERLKLGQLAPHLPIAPVVRDDLVRLLCARRAEDVERSGTAADLVELAGRAGWEVVQLGRGGR